ncbi:MAG: dUTP diphosphatase [Clostridia bacterium]|nr:dUTP diphosphatase [Clostridia bacterium]
MFKPKINFVKMSENAVIPKFAHASDAGMDLYATEACEIKTGEYKIVKTGLQMSMPFGYEAQIRSRSGLAAKAGVSVLNSPGTIDSDYRGEVGVILINHGQNTFKIEVGDRIAQMVINKLTKFEVKQLKFLDRTTRGEGGFGSTGVKKL